MTSHKSFTDQPDTWWDPNGPFWTLHAINPIRSSFIFKHGPKQGKALDVGCGGGILSEKLLDRYQVIGIDLDEQLIQIAQSRKSQAEYRHTESHQLLNEHTEQFDVITCLEVLEHVENPRQTVQDIATLLKPGGYAFFSTLNRNMISYLGAIVAAEYILKILPKHTHQYEDFVRPKEMIMWCQENNLQLVEMQGIHYNPFNKTFFVNPSTVINYIACFHKPVS